MQPHFGFLTALALLAGACTIHGAQYGDTPFATDCSVAAQKVWLRDYMADWYYWAGSAPNPEPDGFATIQDYFEALLFTGNALVPADFVSSIGDTARRDDFFDGEVLGYGLFVNILSQGYLGPSDRHIELQLPLKVRFTEEQSPAAAAGLKRGDIIVSINGQASADISAGNDVAALTATKEGDTLEVVIDDGFGPATYNLVARTYTVTPVPVATVLSSANGIKVGYLLLSACIPTADAALRRGLASIREQGATELIVDLRYNHGGSFDTATLLASLIAGDGHVGEVFERLTYNSMHQGANQTFTLSAPQAPAFRRVLLLTGRRSCPASELVVNGLRPFVDVVTVGGTTCGDPFGEDAVQHCGSEYAMVSSEATNSLGQGQYYDGIAATCPVEDDFSGTLGSPSEKLTAAALSYIDSGGKCPSAE